MATRCHRCGGRNGCTDMDCVPAPDETNDDDLPETECLAAIYKCPVCTQELDHYNAAWLGGVPMHPLCKIAYESEFAEAQPDDPKSPAVHAPPEESAIVRPIILTLNFPVPVLLSPDNAVQEIRDTVEDFLAGVILAYRQGEIKYDFATAVLNLEGVQKLVEPMIKEMLVKTQVKIKETLRDTEDRSK